MRKRMYTLVVEINGTVYEATDTKSRVEQCIKRTKRLAQSMMSKNPKIRVKWGTGTLQLSHE